MFSVTFKKILKQHEYNLILRQAKEIIARDYLKNLLKQKKTETENKQPKFKF